MCYVIIDVVCVMLLLMLCVCYVVKPVLMLYQNKPKSNSSNSVKQDPGKAAPPSSNSGRTVQAVKSEHNQGELQHSS